MVAELRGKIDGKEIIFERSTENEWKATIPRELCGFYIVELEAFDEAGNRAYVAKFLLAFDPACLYVELTPIKYQSFLVPCEFIAKAAISNYYAELNENTLQGGDG